MQFSTDERHGATLDFLAGVRDYIARLPAHPMNRDMIQRIEAHLAEPVNHLCRFQKATAPVHWVGRTECIGLLTRPVQ